MRMRALNLKTYRATILIPQERLVVAADIEEAARRFKSAVGTEHDGRPLKNRPFIAKIVEEPDETPHAPRTAA